jgi:hypothetical protein
LYRVCGGRNILKQSVFLLFLLFFSVHRPDLFLYTFVDFCPDGEKERVREVEKGRTSLNYKLFSLSISVNH